MKKKFLIGMEVAALVLSVSISAFAQSENAALIEVVNDPIPAKTVQAQAAEQVVTAQPIVVQKPQMVQQAPQYMQQPQIVQQQPTIYVQRESTTVVQDTPLVESSADKLRKQRIEMEQQTESKIVQKLEEERMKAEEKRANKLLSNLEEKEEVKKEEKQEDPQVEVIAPVPVMVAPQQIQVVEPVAQEPTPIQVKSELAELDEKQDDDKRYYVTFDTGFISYDAENVDTGVGLGANFGTIFDEKYIIEANFMFTRADIEQDPAIYNGYSVYPTIVQMDQYNFGGTVKYRILKTRFSPYVGGSLSYTYRDYKDEQSFGYYNYGTDALSASSWAVDMGLLVGADIRLTENFSVGSEFKYMFNIAYDVSTSNGLQASTTLYPDFYSNPIEELGYYSLSLSLKYLF